MGSSQFLQKALILQDKGSLCLQELLLAGNSTRSSLISCSTDRGCSSFVKNETRSPLCLLLCVCAYSARACAHLHVHAHTSAFKYLLWGYQNLTFSPKFSFCKRRDRRKSQRLLREGIKVKRLGGILKKTDKKEQISCCSKDKTQMFFLTS